MTPGRRPESFCFNPPSCVARESQRFGLRNDCVEERDGSLDEDITLETRCGVSFPSCFFHVENDRDVALCDGDT